MYKEIMEAATVAASEAAMSCQKVESLGYSFIVVHENEEFMEFLKKEYAATENHKGSGVIVWYTKVYNSGPVVYADTRANEHRAACQAAVKILASYGIPASVVSSE